MVTNIGRAFLGSQPRHCISTNASHVSSATAVFLVYSRVTTLHTDVGLEVQQCNVQWKHLYGLSTRFILAEAFWHQHASIIINCTKVAAVSSTLSILQSQKCDLVKRRRVLVVTSCTVWHAVRHHVHTRSVLTSQLEWRRRGATFGLIVLRQRQHQFTTDN